MTHDGTDTQYRQLIKLCYNLLQQEIVTLVQFLISSTITSRRYVRNHILNWFGSILVIKQSDYILN